MGKKAILTATGIFLTAGALFAQKINTQAANAPIGRQLPLSEKAASSVKIVETKNGKEVWVEGLIGRIRIDTFPKGADVEVAMPSASGNGARLSKVADSEPQTDGSKLHTARANFSENSSIDSQVNGVDHWADSNGSPMHKPIADNGTIVFNQGGGGNGNDSAKIYVCKGFDILPKDIFGTIDAEFMKVETFYAYNITDTTDYAVYERIKQTVMKYHNNQFDAYIGITYNVSSNTNKYIVVAFTYLDANYNPTKKSPVPSNLSILGVSDSALVDPYRYVLKLIMNSVGLTQVFGWTDQENNKYKVEGIGPGSFNPLTPAIDNVIITGVENRPSVLPTKFRVESYPNPFNPSTTIRFDLPRTGRVAVKVINTAGQTVTNLDDRVLVAGTHEVRFDAAKLGLSSGVYYGVVFVDGQYQGVTKMMLVK